MRHDRFYLVPQTFLELRVLSKSSQTLPKNLITTAIFAETTDMKTTLPKTVRAMTVPPSVT